MFWLCTYIYTIIRVRRRIDKVADNVRIRLAADLVILSKYKIFFDRRCVFTYVVYTLRFINPVVAVSRFDRSALRRPGASISAHERYLRLSCRIVSVLLLSGRRVDDGRKLKVRDLIRRPTSHKTRYFHLYLTANSRDNYVRNSINGAS